MRRPDVQSWEDLANDHGCKGGPDLDSPHRFDGAECAECGATTDVRLFDNHGETFDRYTAVFYVDGQCVGYRGMSDNPFDPQGFGIWDDGDCSGTIERDTEIAVEDAPEPVQRCIAVDLSEIQA